MKTRLLAISLVVLVALAAVGDRLGADVARP